MSKFYEVSRVLDKRTDAHCHVQYLVRWGGYGKKNDSWVDEANTNERLKQVFRTRHQGTPGLLQTLAVLVAEKLNMKKPPTTSIVRRASVTMLMDAETFKELDAIVPAAWSPSTSKTSTPCRLQPGKPVEITLLERKKVFFDHSGVFALSRWEWSPCRLQRHGAESSVRFNSFKGLILP